jgi:hypothetical protein
MVYYIQVVTRSKAGRGIAYMDTSDKWTEDPLPSNCPPDDANEPHNEAFYRLVESFPPRHEDFYSLRKKYPNKKPFSNQDECTQRSCSLFLTYKACDLIRKTFTKHKTERIVKIILPPSCGLIKRTGPTSNHYSWWMVKGFNPIPCCQEENE